MIRLSLYIEEKLAVLLVNFGACLLLSLFTLAMGLPFQALIVIWTAWLIILILMLAAGYIRLRRRYKEVFKRFSDIDKKYLAGELLEKPSSIHEALYYTLLKQAGRSMLEEINRQTAIQQEYKEYIEEWIHEVKTPIAAIDMICKNHPSKECKSIAKELSNIRYLVEQTLYYARSGCVEKDYFIKRFPLFDALPAALMNFSASLMEEKIALDIREDESAIVYTDEKWLSYIIEQILSNAIKYRQPEHPVIRISCKKQTSGIFLIIEDNGAGIAPEDLPRIFEKGFTGGCRQNRHSTGMGLYLCKKLCDKLGLTLLAESEPMQGTKVFIGFPAGQYNRPDI